VKRPLLFWIAIGSFVGAISAFIAVSAAAAGHGTYLPAAVLFPFSLGLAFWAGSITAPLVALALAQFPVYGVLIGRWGFTRPSAALVGCHVLAAIFSAYTVSVLDAF
jgi:hypothetical protein